MEEINKRFKVIEAAIDLPDYEVIDRQIAHLRNMSTDKGLHSILRDLENKNFRQALYDMHNYSATVKDDFFDGSSAADTHVVDDSPSPLKSSQEANLFSAALDAGGEEQVIDVDDMLRMTEESTVVHSGDIVDNHTTIEESQDPINEDIFEHLDIDDDPLFALDHYIESEDELSVSPPDTDGIITAKDTESTKEVSERESPYSGAPLFTEDALSDEETPLYVANDPEPEPEPETNTREREDFSMDLFDGGSESFPETTNHTHDTQEHDTIQAGMAAGALSAAISFEKKKDGTPNIVPDSDELQTDVSTATSTTTPSVKRAWDFEPDEEEKLYKKFAYTDQKFRNMLHQHPQTEELEDGVCAEVKDFIRFVSTHDYAESHVESAINRYQELKDEGKKAESAQMLIAAATTESTFAQFMLARELFKGEVLQQNYPESFTQINQLAEEDYPEAICDLGQLYEYGIGIDKNRNHALLLYEEAAEMGVERAKKHYERLKSANPIRSFKSITSSLWGRKRG